MEVAARPASDEDLEVVVALHDAAVEELRVRRGGEMWVLREARGEPYGEGLARALSDERSWLVVGTIDGAIVGYAVVHRESLHDGSEVGDLTDLYVHPDARGVGVGEALMTLVNDWCRDSGCIGIDSIALPGDRETKNFFETFGLVARALRVHRSF